MAVTHAAAATSEEGAPLQAAEFEERGRKGGRGDSVSSVIFSGYAVTVVLLLVGCTELYLHMGDRIDPARADRTGIIKE